MSPFVIGALSSSRPKAGNPPVNSPAPTVAAPAAIIPFLKNERRFAGRFMRPSSCFMVFSLV
jgi:hypothetical protein